jgi:FtsH-binding integral membrane protein
MSVIYKNRKLSYHLLNCNWFPRIAMDINTQKEDDNRRIKKYHLAGKGFFVINLVYLGLFYFFPPPFELELLGKVILIAFLIALIVFLSRLIYKGKRKLVITLAVIYALRVILVISSVVMMGDMIDFIPYALTCMILIFYLLGRAAWNWK